jgi:lipopolysaccharide export LptBFGC system permease protein LptF
LKNRNIGKNILEFHFVSFKFIAMIQRFLLLVFLVFGTIGQAQSREALEKYISNTLSYQHINNKASGKESLINIYQIEFEQCTMNYLITRKNKNKNKIERYVVRANLRGISKITMTKSKEGYNVITFTGTGTNILKEYPDGNLVHQKSQFIPLKAYDPKALDYFQKLMKICNKM